MEGDEALPDHLRCKRTDGRQWRCNRKVMENKKLCEIHHLQGRHRQYKQKVPESLKLQRKDSKNKNKKSKSKSNNTSDDVAVRAQKRKRRRGGGAICKSEALDEAVKKMRLKKGDLELELIRMVLKREVEKKKKKERDFEESNDFEDGELMRDLPNGLMAISSSPHFQDNNNNNNNADHSNNNNNNVDVNVNVNSSSSFDVKIGAQTVKTVKRRSFRSKNIDPLPLGAVQALPCVGSNLVSLRRGKRKRCHWCRRSGIRRLVKCSSCRKEFFCLDCIKERFVFSFFR